VHGAVAASRARCAARGLDPEADAPTGLSADALEQERARHPLAPLLPVVRRLLVDAAVEEDLVVAVTDAAGCLLWVEGHPGTRRRAERIHFEGGARWDEASAGTNAPALALALDAGVRVHAAEHWARPVQPFSCSAAPVHDPRTGVLLGALDVTGDGRAATATALALVRATALAVEGELLVRAQRLPAGRPVLRLLGAQPPTLVAGGAATRLSLRHAELLLLLAEHPEGLWADALAGLLSGRDLDPVTVRAELSRLRRALPAGLLDAKPYRLCQSPDSDVSEVRRLLDAGRVADALDAYAGPLLPRSDAPGVVRLREELAAEVRAAVLDAGELALVLRWLGTPDGADDLPAWQAVAAGEPVGVQRARGAARARLLDGRLGAGAPAVRPGTLRG